MISSIERFRRYGKPKHCLFKYTSRVQHNCNVGTCACAAWSAFGIPDKATGKALWQKHIEDVQAGITPEPRVHR